jgi:hypothetical protein
MKNIKKIAQEIINDDNWEKAKKLANTVADYLQTKIPDSLRDSGRKSVSGWDITFTDKSKYNYQPSRNTYSVIVRPDFPTEVILNFYEEKEIKSESLADPKKNWRTDSGRIVTLQKKKIKMKDYENENKAKKAIDSFFKIKE